MTETGRKGERKNVESASHGEGQVERRRNGAMFAISSGANRNI